MQETADLPSAATSVSATHPAPAGGGGKLCGPVPLFGFVIPLPPHVPLLGSGAVAVTVAGVA